MPSKVWYTNVSYGFCLVCIFAYAILRRNKSDKPDEEEECHDIFVPTYEWQVVKKGQVVPEGLYVRMNFETGITEAKLINDTPDYVTRNMENCNNNNEANQPIFSLSELQTYLTRRN